MRLKLTLRTPSPVSRVPLSYSYYLSTAIYRWIHASSPEYAAFLHDGGFRVVGTLRRFKHFCFSQLVVPQRKVVGDQLNIFSPTVDWYVGMPVEPSLQHMVTGMFEHRELYIEREENRFVVEQVETLPEPHWERKMSFRMLSPLTVSMTVGKDEKLMPYYLKADDPRLSEALRTNIVNKYRSLYGADGAEGVLQPDCTEMKDAFDFDCRLDERFIAARGGPEKISKLITIKQGRPDETRVRGFMCPVTLEGDPALIALAYEVGLGEKNSLGFGMLEVL